MAQTQYSDPAPAEKTRPPEHSRECLLGKASAHSREGIRCHLGLQVEVGVVRGCPSALPACPLTWTTVDVASHCVPSRLKVSTLVPWREPCCHSWWADVLDVGTTGEQAEAPCGSGASPALASLAALPQGLEMSFCGSDANSAWISLLSLSALPWCHIIPGLTYKLRVPFAIHG